MDLIHAKKSLGQNFLKDETILKKIADSFSTTKEDLIIEIGPGKGALTKYLIQKPSTTICYELDNRMKSVLLSFENDRCQFIFGDFLKQDLSVFSKNYHHTYVIANIPYYITTPILNHIIESNLIVDGMTIMVQKEVALRFTALPKTKNYGYYTVLLQHYFDAEYLFDVPPSAFNPSPNVMSSVVRFVRKASISDIDFSKFQQFLVKAFSQKRKTLKNNLKNFNWSNISKILSKYSFLDSVRAEEIPYDVFVEIFLNLND